MAKHIIDIVKCKGYDAAKDENFYAAEIAWLEKQGETFTKKDVDDAYLKGVCDAKHELEKQGEKGTNGNEREIPNSEQKPADKVEPKFKVGCVIQQIKPHDNIPLRVVYIGAGSYQCESDDLKIRYSFPIKEQDDWELIEQKPAEWSAEDEEKVKAMCEDGNLKPSERAWLKSLKDRLQPKPMFNGKMDIEVWKSTNGQYVLKVNGNVIRGQLYG